MKPSKERKIIEAVDALEYAGIEFKIYNNGVHFKIGSINFYPTTGKWFDEVTKDKGVGIDSLISLLSSAGQVIRKPSVIDKRVFTVEELFEIAKRSEIQSLYGVCEAIHKEIYGKL